MGVISEAAESALTERLKKILKTSAKFSEKAGINGVKLAFKVYMRHKKKSKENFAESLKESIENASDENKATVVSIDELKESGTIKKLDGNLSKELMGYFEPYCVSQKVQYAVICDKADGKDVYTIFFKAQDAAQIAYCLEKGLSDYEKELNQKKEQEQNAERKEEATRENKQEQNAKREENDMQQNNQEKNAEKKEEATRENKKAQNQSVKKEKNPRATKDFLKADNGSIEKALRKKIKVADKIAGEKASELSKEKTRSHSELQR